MPNTVDLVQHAELCINAITRTLDPQQKYRTYFIGDISSNPPRLVGPPNLHGKFWESLALVRLMTGNQANRLVDDAWVSELDDLSRKLERDTVNGGRILSMLALYYRLTENLHWLKYGNRMVDQWQSGVVNKDDFAFFPPKSAYALDATGSRRLEDYKLEVPTGWPATFSGWALQGLSVYYRETGYKPALNLATKLARFLRYHGGVFSEHGHFLAAHDGYLGPQTALHFHHNANAAVALLEYALASGERDYAQFAGKCYEFAKSTGNPVVGFFPEYIERYPDDRGGKMDCEGCCVADMVALALKLTEAGIGDFWDDVDHYVRNLLTEMQMKSARWLEDALHAKPARAVDPTTEDANQAAERLVGSFAGWSGPNQFRVHERGIMQCCLGNCARALYYVWERMLREEPGQFTLELWLNRVAAMADVASDLPYAGRIEVGLKQPCRLRLRRPQWLDASTVKMNLENSLVSVPFQVDKHFLVTDRLPAKSRLQVSFDLPQRTIKTKVGHLNATLTLRGDEIVGFSPPGEVGPYWQDKPVDRQGVPETERTYFIPTRTIYW